MPSLNLIPRTISATKLYPLSRGHFSCATIANLKTIANPVFMKGIHALVLCCRPSSHSSYLPQHTSKTTSRCWNDQCCGVSQVLVVHSHPSIYQCLNHRQLPFFGCDHQRCPARCIDMIHSSTFRDVWTPARFPMLTALCRSSGMVFSFMFFVGHCIIAA